MPIIAITKEMWSLGSSIGREVATQLGYEFIRQDIIREAAREYHALEAKLVEAVEEKPGFSRCSARRRGAITSSSQPRCTNSPCESGS